MRTKSVTIHYVTLQITISVHFIVHGPVLWKLNGSEIQLFIPKLVAFAPRPKLFNINGLFPVYTRANTLYCALFQKLPEN